jgi:excisionase family DNA binding protein
VPKAAKDRPDRKQVAALIAEMLESILTLPTEISAMRDEVREIRSLLLARDKAPKLFTIADAARQLGISVSSVRRRVQDGTLKHRRIGRSVRVEV